VAKLSIMAKNVRIFIILFVISILININLIKILLHHTLNHNFSTHIIIIPFISIFLILRERTSIFNERTDYCWYGGIILLLGFIIAGPWVNSDLSLRVLGMVLIWIGMFILIFGMYSFRKALFPLLFLILMIPIPETILQQIITILQKGSAEGTAILFQLTATPFFRDGLYFSLPSVNIEIATECSSIRSSLALLISSLLASYLFLISSWRRTLFVLMAIPMAMVKNSIRIVVLSLLAIHRDQRWLTDSQLHSEGGIVFFILALILLFPLLWRRP